MKLHCTVLILVCCIVQVCYAQQFPHPGAHAHNDYVHDRPLFEALASGFTSIEADVHLIDGKLIVLHDHPTGAMKTLETLYLKPLDSIIKKNNGQVYLKYSHPVIIMIDVKTAAEPTFIALQETLKKYRNNLHRQGHPGAIQIVVSGNRAIQLINRDPDRLCTIDGRPSDLGTGYSVDIMPVISEAYIKVASESKDVPSAKALELIQQLAANAHKEHKKLRLWAIPDNEEAWKALTSAGVDIINTDKLSQFHHYASTTR